MGHGGGAHVSSTLQGLKPGQGIPTKLPGHLLVKTTEGLYQILRASESCSPKRPSLNIDFSKPPPGYLPVPPEQQQQRDPFNARQLPPPPQPRTAQQMTPDTAKLKCKDILAALVRLASEQPAVVGVRALVQGLIDGAVDPKVCLTVCL